MEKINQIIELVKQPQHMPWAISFIAGVLAIRKDRQNGRGDEILGDNVPTTLIDGMRW